jgi:transposase
MTEVATKRLADARMAAMRLILLPEKYEDFTKEDREFMRSDIVGELLNGEWPTVLAFTFNKGFKMQSDNQNNSAPVKGPCAGRKTKYSPALIKKLCSYIEDGLNNKQACQAVGIGETTLREWRNEHEGLAERVEAAREVMRSKVLAKIKAAGKDDWRAHVEFLRLAFAEYRVGNSQQVNVAIQQNNMAVSDPERAELIEMRARALANNSKASEPLQLADASDVRDARAIAEEAERNLGAERPAQAEPERLREHAPRIERADWRDERSRPFRDWEEIGSEDGLG